MHVVFDRPDGNDKDCRDLLVADAGGEIRRNLSLARRQGREGVTATGLLRMNDRDDRLARQHGDRCVDASQGDKSRAIDAPPILRRDNGSGAPNGIDHRLIHARHVRMLA